MNIKKLGYESTKEKWCNLIRFVCITGTKSPLCYWSQVDGSQCQGGYDLGDVFSGV